MAQGPKKGSKHWLSRSTHGRAPIFDDPDTLWSACCEYFEWVEQNPLKEEKIFHHQGAITRTHQKRMRPMTISGLCLFLDISRNTWFNYRERDSIKDVVATVEQVIYTQKFEGAAADMLNASIIARELGLKEATSSEVTMDARITKSVGDMSDEELEFIASGSGSGTLKA